MDRHRRFTAASFRKYLAEADPARADFEKITMVVRLDGDYATISTFTDEEVPVAAEPEVVEGPSKARLSKKAAGE